MQVRDPIASPRFADNTHRAAVARSYVPKTAQLLPRDPPRSTYLFAYAYYGERSAASVASIRQTLLVFSCLDGDECVVYLEP